MNLSCYLEIKAKLITNILNIFVIILAFYSFTYYNKYRTIEQDEKR